MPLPIDTVVWDIKVPVADGTNWSLGRESSVRRSNCDFSTLRSRMIVSPSTLAVADISVPMFSCVKPCSCP